MSSKDTREDLAEKIWLIRQSKKKDSSSAKEQLLTEARAAGADVQSSDTMEELVEKVWLIRQAKKTGPSSSTASKQLDKPDSSSSSNSTSSSSSQTPPGDHGPSGSAASSKQKPKQKHVQQKQRPAEVPSSKDRKAKPAIEDSLKEKNMKKPSSAIKND